LSLDQAERFVVVAVAEVVGGWHEGSLKTGMSRWGSGAKPQAAQLTVAGWAFLPAKGRTAPRSSCGRGITCTPMTSPTRPAAAAPASTAALTAATSPTTIAVTRPLPIFCQPIRVTFADFNMASLASINATRPLVSTMPRASMGVAPAIRVLLFLGKYAIWVLVLASPGVATPGLCG